MTSLCQPGRGLRTQLVGMGPVSSPSVLSRARTIASGADWLAGP